jgi:excisionase family DNA binding protein
VPTDVISTKEAAAHLGVSVATVARLVTAGRLTPALKLEGIRGAMWFHRTDIAALTSTEAAS